MDRPDPKLKSPTLADVRFRVLASRDILNGLTKSFEVWASRSADPKAAGFVQAQARLRHATALVEEVLREIDKKK